LTLLIQVVSDVVIKMFKTVGL